MPISLIILAVVFILIAVRRVGRFHLPIWGVMAAGAVAVLATGQITPTRAAMAIDIDVMLFLFGVFVVGRALESSGYLFRTSHALFGRARSADMLMLAIIFGAGFTSAFLMNDTLAIIGTPLVLLLAREHRMAPQALLLALAFSVTLGSVMSPIGNPQNLLIALQGQFENPFIDFAQRLAVPTLINLALVFVLLKWYYRESFHAQELVHTQVELSDPDLARLARWALILLIVLVAVKIGLVFVGVGTEFRLTYIALIAAAPVLLLSRTRWQVLRHLDWRTLAFFAAMFVLMESVWATGFLQSFMPDSPPNGASIPWILSVSVLVSQLISNVPLVALCLPLLQSADATPDQYLALAAGSTVAGNLFILGAASNVIIIQNAEKHGHTIGFIEFARVGIPLTALNVLVYWLYLTWF